MNLLEELRMLIHRLFASPFLTEQDKRDIHRIGTIKRLLGLERRDG
jgi:hypothetical protein